MKSILELIAIMKEDGSSAITDVKIRINQLMELTKDGFNLDESTSRSIEDGALTDLRIPHPLVSSDPTAIEIRRRLTLLQNNYNLIKFEEKIDKDTNQSIFIITEIAYPDFLSKTCGDFQFREQEYSPKVDSIVIRTGLHNIRFDYVKVAVGKEEMHPIQEIQLIKESSSEEDKEVITSSRKSTDNNFSILGCLSSQDQKDFQEIKKALNQFCDLPANNEFALYFQSSNPEFPIDLRVFLDENDENTKNSLLKFSGFAQHENGKELIYEVKTLDDSPQIALIIKAVNKDKLKEYFTHNQKVHLEGDQLKKSLALIKEHFPHDKQIQDLVIVSGKGSFTKPFPHIRTNKFWSNKETSSDTFEKLIDLKNIGCIDFDRRPENKFTVEKRNKADYVRLTGPNHFFQNDNYQWIISPKNIDLLKCALEATPISTASTGA